MENYLIWLEKYRPKTLDQVQGNQDIVDKKFNQLIFLMMSLWGSSKKLSSSVPEVDGSVLLQSGIRADYENQGNQIGRKRVRFKDLQKRQSSKNGKSTQYYDSWYSWNREKKQCSMLSKINIGGDSIKKSVLELSASFDRGIETERKNKRIYIKESKFIRSITQNNTY